MNLQNNIYSRKIKQLEEIVSKGSQNHLDLIKTIIKILEHQYLTNISPELFDEIGKMNKKTKEALNKLSQNVSLNKDEFKLDMDDLTKLYQDLDDLLDL